MLEDPDVDGKPDVKTGLLALSPWVRRTESCAQPIVEHVGLITFMPSGKARGLKLDHDGAVYISTGWGYFEVVFDSTG
jgi:hypothetical protein